MIALQSKPHTGEISDNRFTKIKRNGPDIHIEVKHEKDRSDVDGRGRGETLKLISVRIPYEAKGKGNIRCSLTC